MHSYDNHVKTVRFIESDSEGGLYSNQYVSETQISEKVKSLWRNLQMN